MMIAFKVIMLAIVIILVALVTAFIYISRIPVYPKRLDIKKMEEDELAKDFMQDYVLNYSQEYLIDCPDGYKLHAALIPAKEESDKYVIIHHGFTANRSGAIKYSKAYQELGYNCVAIDARAHGANDKAKCTFGIVEKYDLMAVIDDTYERYGQNIHLGIQSESMGSIISVQALALKPRIDFLVADCGAANLLGVLRTAVSSMIKVPAWFADVACFFAKIVWGVDFASIRPVEALVDNEIPICFAHGAKDQLIYCKNSVEMNQVNKGYSEYHEFLEATHAISIDSDFDGYKTMIQNFLEKVYSK